MGHGSYSLLFRLWEGKSESFLQHKFNRNELVKCGLPCLLKKKPQQHSRITYYHYFLMFDVAAG